MTMRRWALGALAATLVGAGCGEAGGAGQTASDGAQTGARDAAQGVRFAECMRGSGVPDFPDPNPDGEFEYGVSVTPTVWQAALDACEKLQPPGTLSAERTPDEQAAALVFARCMREHGVEDFPDPVDGEPLINTYEIPSSQQPGGMDILDAAIAQCREP